VIGPGEEHSGFWAKSRKMTVLAGVSAADLQGLPYWRHVDLSLSVEGRPTAIRNSMDLADKPEEGAVKETPTLFLCSVGCARAIIHSLN
jgi:hypothetical protein